MNNILKDYKLKKVIIFGIIIALVTHGYTLFNNFCFHDNVDIFGLGSTAESGRFSLDCFKKVIALFLGFEKNGSYNLTLLNGLLSIAFLSLTAYFIVKILKINNEVIIYILTAFIIVHPSIVSTLGYRYTSHLYYFANLVGTLCIYLYTLYIEKYKNNNILLIILLSFITAFAVGIYQSFLANWCTIILLYYFSKIVKNDFLIKQEWKNIIFFIFFLILTLVFYVILLKVFLIIYSRELLNYKGINNFGNNGIKEYINRLVLCYKHYFVSMPSEANITPGSSVLFDKILKILFFVLLIKYCYKKSFYKVIYMTVIILLLPIAINLNILMSGINTVGANQMNSLSLIHIPLLILLDEKLKTKLIYVCYIFLGMMVIFYVYFANICYLKAEFIQRMNISYFNNLITKITDCEGYSEDKKICYYNEFHKSEKVYNIPKEFRKIVINIYNEGSGINNYAWKDSMRLNCGFNQEYIEDDIFRNNETVLKMPSYPERGSIKVVDDVIVVKFADYEYK